MVGSKRGNLMDINIIPYIIFFVILVVVIGGTILHNLNQQVQSDTGASVVEKEVMSKYLTKYRQAFDTGILLYYFILVVVTMISAYFIKTNPLFFTAAFIMWILSMVTLPYIGNAAINILNADGITAFSNSMTGLRLLLKYFVLINVIAGAGILYALYSKSNQNVNDIGIGGGDDAFN